MGDPIATSQMCIPILSPQLQSKEGGHERKRTKESDRFEKGIDEKERGRAEEAESRRQRWTGKRKEENLHKFLAHVID